MTPIDQLNSQAGATKLNQKYSAALAALASNFANLANVHGLKYLQTAPQMNGYDAAAYFHAASTTLIFVNRGADGFRSFTDWIEGGHAAVARRFNGPLKGSVEFVLDTTAKLSTARGLGGVKIAQVSEISCVGHSWGGACAEAQVALSQAVAAKRSKPISQPMSGVGFGSAGFANAIHAYSADEGVAVEDDMHWLMNHFIRTADPILLQPNHELLGDHFAIPAVYVTSRVASANGRGFEFGLAPPLLTNHDSELYFQHFDLRGAKHLFMTRNKTFLLCDGIVPPKLRFGTVQPESVIVGTQYP